MAPPRGQVAGTTSYCPLPVLQMLVSAGADIHARSKTNASILHYAAEAGRLDSLLWMLENSSLGIDERGSHRWTPLHYAAAANQVQVARFLLDRGANANARSAPGNHTPLHLAAAYIDGEVNAVFDDGNDDASLVECLLLHGADVAALGDRRALVSDSARGEELHDWKYTDTEEEEAGLPLEDVHPLHCAAFAGKINIAEKLLAAGADIHCRTSIKGSTPLHIAAAQFLLEMVRFLLRNGAECTLEDYGGRKMVHHLAFMARRKPERVKTFLVDEGIYHPEMEGDLDWRQGIEMMQEYYEMKNLGRIMVL
ncbi:ankyrin repeat-containing domain protein [Aspergillus germanicus]